MFKSYNTPTKANHSRERGLTLAKVKLTKRMFDNNRSWFYCREWESTLAKVKYDSRLKEDYVWDSIRLDDPLAYYIIECQTLE